eukprot:TRINITY_DN698_c0_g1_i6.p1 TRINITY_DN698_c0_g1~~TRINITY_DN698_c0_g1_i6.p1  ORF type:complete len:341 (+),score=109.56 TRINITY_DN698_c0_g1_i6:1426-2448(+)
MIRYKRDILSVDRVILCLDTLLPKASTSSTKTTTTTTITTTASNNEKDPKEEDLDEEGNDDMVSSASSSMVEDQIECWATLISTVGKAFDNEAYKEKCDQYMNVATKLSTDPSLSARIRFQMMDVLDLRNANWVPRHEGNNPRSLQSIKNEATLEELATQANAKEFEQKKGNQYRKKQASNSNSVVKEFRRYEPQATSSTLSTKNSNPNTVRKTSGGSNGRNNDDDDDDDDDDDTFGMRDIKKNNTSKPASLGIGSHLLTEESQDSDDDFGMGGTTTDFAWGAKGAGGGGIRMQESLDDEGTGGNEGKKKKWNGSGKRYSRGGGNRRSGSGNRGRRGGRK